MLNFIFTGNINTRNCFNITRIDEINSRLNSENKFSLLPSFLLSVGVCLRITIRATKFLIIANVSEKVKWRKTKTYNPAHSCNAIKLVQC